MIVSALIVSFHLIGLVTAGSMLMSHRAPQSAVAWMLSLVAVPYVAVPAYWLFGRSDFTGYQFARRSSQAEFRAELASVPAKIEPYVDSIGWHDGGLQAATTLAQMPVTRGNAVDLLVDGDATFESLLSGIAEARSYLLVQFYIVRDDGLGRRLKDAMIERRRAGVEVRFLYDEIGSYTLTRTYLQELRDAGVEVSSFHGVRGIANRFQINFRNHRKIVVVDGEVAWVGGLNVGDEYIGLHPQLTPWRDTHLRVAGPAALALQLSFLEDWYWARKEVLDLDWTPVPSTTRDQSVLILPTGPADPVESASLMIQQAIHSARERIWIASPYFVPDDGVRDALALAALRDVDVRVMIPAKADHVLVYLSAFAFMDRLLEVGVKIHRYTGGFLHQKAFLIDDQAAAVGTVNLDNRSFSLNFEVTALVVDEAFAAEVAEVLERDFNRSVPVTLDDLAERSFLKRLASRVAYLFAPIL